MNAPPEARAWKILVVDDEPVQLDSIRRGLTLYGCEVMTALDGDEAMAVLKGQHGPTIDLLLTDLTMPSTSGCELLAKAKELFPSLPAIVITGLTYSPDIAAARRAGAPIMQKPFSPHDLFRAICARLVQSERRRGEGASAHPGGTRCSDVAPSRDEQEETP